MSTDNAPKPPDQPASESPAAGVAEAEAVPVLPLNEEMARMLEEQVDIIAQRQVYHTQLMFGVSGLGTDPVNARNSTLIIASALRNNTPEVVKYTLANLGDAQINQINDHTTPFNFHQQVAGLLEGILVDTVAQSMREDPDRRREACKMLEDLFVEANEEIEQEQPSSLAFRLVLPAAEPPKQLT